MGQQPNRQQRRDAARAERERRAAAAATRQRQRRALLAAVAVTATAVVAIAVALGSSSDGDRARGDVPASPHGAHAPAAAALLDGIPQDGTLLGQPDAPVTLVEFADLQCPFCRNFAVEVLPEIVEHYVRPGKVRLDLRLLRFVGEDSRRAAAVAAAAAAQNRMWHFADLFYRNQGVENSGYATDEFLRAIAGAAGLDAGRALAGRNGAAAERLLAGGERRAAAAGVHSTPSFLVGPTGGSLRPLETRSLDSDEFHSALDAQLDR